MRRYTNMFSSKHNQLSGRALLVMMTSSLLLAACSQSNTGTSDSNPYNLSQLSPHQPLR